VHVVMGVSILFNIMGFANRFRLWRIDASRVKAEQELARCFGPGTTLGDLGRIDPREASLGPEIRRELERIVHELEALADRSRRQSLSILVPMGGEMAYRYQEGVISKTVGVLRGLLSRWDEGRS